MDSVRAQLDALMGADRNGEVVRGARTDNTGRLSSVRVLNRWLFYAYLNPRLSFFGVHILPVERSPA